METTILKAADQNRSVFDGAKVRSRNAVYFESEVVGYSNLYHLAFFWSDEGGVVESPERNGFEVVTYILEGSVTYSSNLDEERVEVPAGGAVLIKSASGLDLKEEYSPGTRCVQVFLDPDFRISLQRSASLSFYEPDEFVWEELNGVQVLDFDGDDSPIWFSSAADIKIWKPESGTFSLECNPGEYLCGILISGKAMLEGQELGAEDFFLAGQPGVLEFEVLEPCIFYALKNPVSLDFKTYNEQLQLST